MHRRGHTRLSMILASVLSGALLVAQEEPAKGKIEGRVLGPLGDPMAGVSVWAAIWPDLDTVIARSQTDGEGMFVLSRLPTRSISLFATSDGHTIAWGSARLSASRPFGGTTLRLWQASTIRGRVIDAEGKPLRDVHVLGTKDFTWLSGRFRSPETRTDDDGKFELAGVPLGDQVVRAWAPGFVMREHKVVSTTTADIEVRLRRGKGVQVKIESKGVAAKQALDTKVRIYPTRDGSGFSFLKAIEYDGRLDADGRWSVAGLPDCEWNVQLQSPLYTFDPRRVRLKPGKKAHTLKFESTPVGSLQLRGVLRDPTGQPLAGEKLACYTQRSSSMGGGTPGRTTTDAEGRFTMDAPLVADEPYTLHLVGSRWVLHQEKEKHHRTNDRRYFVRYEDRADPERQLALVARHAVFVTGKVVDENNLPVRFRWCELKVGSSGTGTAMAYTRSDRHGSIQFPGVHPLELDMRIEVSGPVGAAYSKVFRIAPTVPSTITVRVPATGRVTGRVVDAKGRPMPGARLMMQNYYAETGQQIDGSWTRVLTDREGRYAFVGVAPTGHKITVQGGDDKDIQVTELFVVEGGKTAKVNITVEQ